MSRKRIAFAAKLAVSGALFGFLLSRVEIGDLTARIAGATPGLFALAALVLAAQAIVCTLRWSAVLNAIEAPLKFLKVLQIFLIGTFFNQTLPSSAGGDPVRMYKAHPAGLSVAGAVNGVMLERAATVVGLVILVAATQPVFAGPRRRRCALDGACSRAVRHRHGGGARACHGARSAARAVPPLARGARHGRARPR